MSPVSTALLNTQTLTCKQRYLSFFLQAGRKADRQTSRQAGRQTGSRQPDRQTDRQTDRQVLVERDIVYK